MAVARLSSDDDLGSMTRPPSYLESQNQKTVFFVAMLDVDPYKVGRASRLGIPVMSTDRLADVVRKNHVEIGIIAVSVDSAQSVYDALADAGIHAVLNFAPTQLRLRDDVKLKSVDLRINLESLSFHLKSAEDRGRGFRGGRTAGSRPAGS